MGKAGSLGKMTGAERKAACKARLANGRAIGRDEVSAEEIDRAEQLGWLEKGTYEEYRSARSAVARSKIASRLLRRFRRDVLGFSWSAPSYDEVTVQGPEVWKIDPERRIVQYGQLRPAVDAAKRTGDPKLKEIAGRRLIVHFIINHCKLSDIETKKVANIHKTITRALGLLYQYEKDGVIGRGCVPADDPFREIKNLDVREDFFIPRNIKAIIELWASGNEEAICGYPVDRN
jgi:hypothetical protein